MARHKKRRPAGAGGGPGPAGAAGEAGAPAAGAAAQAPEPEPAEYRTKLDVLFWLRVGLAAAAGAAATFIFEPYEGEERRWASIGFMIAVFAATVVAGRAMRIRLPRSERKKLVTQGIGSYVFLYLFVWVATYTLARPGGVGILP